MAGSVVLADQLTKAFAASVDLDSIQPVRNEELALGLAGGPSWLLSLLMLAAVAVFGRSTLRLASAGQLPPWVPGLLIGGAVGNIVDRMWLGSVRDFLTVGHVVLNVADLALLVGVVAHLGLRRREDQPAQPISSRATVLRSPSARRSASDGATCARSA